MKKFFILIFSVFYLSTAMGVNVNLHYCHGEVNSISLFIESGECVCDEYAPEGMIMQCCFDKNYKTEISAEQLSASSAEVLKHLEMSSTPLAMMPTMTYFDSLQWLIHAFLRPPPDIRIPSLPLHILHSVFRL